MSALVYKRNELKDQLQAVNQRRSELVRQGPSPGGETQFHGRLQALDERSTRLDQEILRTDDAIADAINRGVATPQATETFTNVPGQIAGPQPGREAINIDRAMFVLPLMLIMSGYMLWRFAWSRAAKKYSRPVSDQSHRFEQLQQSVDVIALEVERIAEGQRYVTKILNESLQPALGAGAAQPIESVDRNAAPVVRKDSR